MSGPPRAPMALCASVECHEPLVRTLEYADQGYQFLCWKCDRLHQLMEPVPGFATDEARAVQKRYQDEYKADFERRKARAGE